MEKIVNLSLRFHKVEIRSILLLSNVFFIPKLDICFRNAGLSVFKYGVYHLKF
jgi:hypothetical protein